ncbi:MAG: HAD-IIIC family phosphatase, partial [Gemmatimonadota bacterium]|nr:HAD-IIIC family phosphatase [Gemmatimonadota bacterium]
TGAIVVNDFVLPRTSTEGVNAFRRKDTFAHTVGLANKRLRKELALNGTTFLFPFADIVTSIGRGAAIDWRMHYRGHLTWSDALARAVARRWSGYAAAVIGRATKCLVLDLDDTLWGGVLGEVGPDGIAIGPQGEGRAYLDFQRELLDLQRQGILLAVASKNNESEVLNVLRNHPHQLIREEHLAALRVDWNDKASNIRAIASELGIALDHMLFVDDNPRERAWVRQALPELLVPELPADPSEYADWLGTLPSLVLLQQTEEDAARTRQYRDARAREGLRRETADMGEFLRRLAIRVRIEPMTSATRPRAAQLLARTNQFNFTTRRHDESTLAHAVDEGRWAVYTMHVSDTFGDSGLVGLAIVEPRPAEWHIESFLLSCRVIGKSVESALLSAIASDARDAGVDVLTAEFRDSGRNAAARGVLAAHGFKSTDEPGIWRIGLGPDALPWPDHIERERSDAPAGEPA